MTHLEETNIPGHTYDHFQILTLGWHRWIYVGLPPPKWMDNFQIFITRLDVQYHQKQLGGM